MSTHVFIIEFKSNRYVLLPSSSYLRQYRDWDLVSPFDKAPLFYEGADDFTGDKLSKISDEILKVKEVLVARYPGLDLSALRHVKKWMLRYISAKQASLKLMPSFHLCQVLW